MPSHATSALVARVAASCLAVLLAVARVAHAAPPAAAATHTPTASAEPRRIDAVLRAFHDAASPKVLIVAHRGNHIDHPENSIPAITSCADIGADVVEVDLRKTADGRYVLLHDDTVNRTTTGSGRLADMTLAQTRALRLLGPGRSETDLLIPTLEEALDAAKGRVMLNIDLKQGDMREIAAIARDRGVLDHLIFKAGWQGLSADHKAWLTQNPDVVFMPMTSSVDDVHAALAHGPKPAFELKFQTLDPGTTGDKAFIAGLRQRGARPWANTLGQANENAGWSDHDARTDPASVWGVAIDHGMTMIQTDFPHLLAAYLKSRGLNAAP